MSIPESLRSRLEELVGPIAGAEPLGGGCISNACRVSAGGGSVFLKYDGEAPDGFFGAEAGGLERLAHVESGLRIPSVLGFEDSSSGWSWLALEWLEQGSASGEASERLGRCLAELHRSTRDSWGTEEDGYIGTLPQRNAGESDWATFWWDKRLHPQLEMADGLGGDSEWVRLSEALPELLKAATADGPSLLHGDLWGGNVLWSDQGPALVDPACYYGHREVDLAMSELFGGFDDRFYQAYREAWPLQPGYEARKHVYQLYYLLVHVNLFGGSYVPRTIQTLQRALAHA